VIDVGASSVTLALEDQEDQSSTSIEIRATGSVPEVATALRAQQVGVVSSGHALIELDWLRNRYNELVDDPGQQPFLRVVMEAAGRGSVDETFRVCAPLVRHG
jgi:hypothetical protein